MSTPFPAGVPRLEEPPLVLRAFCETDLPLIQEVASDPIIPLITTVPREPDVAAARAFVDRQHQRRRRGEGYPFAIADDATDQALGHIGLWLRDQPPGQASIGYWLDRRHRGRGLARHALGMLSMWGLALPGISRLDCYIEPDNAASRRVAERNGYRCAELLREWREIAGTRRDMYRYSLLATDPTAVRRSDLDGPA